MEIGYKEIPVPQALSNLSNLSNLFRRKNGKRRLSPPTNFEKKS
jgi:hypothetical protein